MTQDHPDWWMEPKPTVYALTDDLAELAARLGSIDVYDRRGDVIYMDKFDKGMGAWITFTSGTGAAVALDTTAPYWPPYHLKLTGGSTSDLYAEARKYFNPPVLGKMGVEFGIALHSAFDYLRIYLIYQSPLAIDWASIELNNTDHKINYLDVNGDYQELDDLPTIVGTSPLYRIFKMVPDLSDGTYVRFLMDQTSYSMTQAYYQGSNLDPVTYLYAGVRLVSRSGENDYCYVDGFVLTQNEP